jgi:hypothetical protein
MTCAVGITGLAWVIATTVNRIVVSDHVRWTAATVHLAIDVALLVWLTSVFVGTQRRARYGRWLGLALIGVLFLLFVAAIGLVAWGDARSSRSGAYLLGEISSGSILPLLCILWWRRFGYSKAARAWFDERAAAPAQ